MENCEVLLANFKNDDGLKKDVLEEEPPLKGRFNGL
jgi:hypothetical protein